MNSLPEGSGGVNIETCTVTIDDGGNCFYGFTTATIFENDKIDSYCAKNYGEMNSVDNHVVLNNVVKNSVVTISMNDA